MSLYFTAFPFKGTICSFGEYIKTQDFNIYNTNEVIIQTQKNMYIYILLTEYTSCSQRKIRSPELCLKVAGSAKYKQNKTV